MPRPLTGEETETFTAIQGASNIALIQTTFDGQDTAVIASIVQDENNGGMVYPLAVLLTPEMMDKLADPFDEDQGKDF
jgi:hypothetical protein